MAANDLRTELAAAAARLIAEEGCEYGPAKRRAVQEILGDEGRRSTMPDNQEVENELRRYLKLFGGEAHRTLLAAMRETAVETMQMLQEFDPHLIGAVLNGTATEHSDIHLQLFVDSAKDVELRLMNLRIEFDADDGDDDADRPAALERLAFVIPINAASDRPLRRVGVRLHVYQREAIRIAPRHRRQVAADADMHPIEAAGRANLESVRRLINALGGGFAAG